MKKMDAALWTIIQSNAQQAAVAACPDLATAKTLVKERTIAQALAGNALEESLRRDRDNHCAHHVLHEAWNAALSAQYEAERVERAFLVAATPFEDRDQWWGWGDICGDAWCAIRRYIPRD